MDRPTPAVESIEILWPAAATTEHASPDAANGALILWSRGRGPHEKPARDSAPGV